MAMKQPGLSALLPFTSRLTFLLASRIFTGIRFRTRYSILNVFLVRGMKTQPML